MGFIIDAEEMLNTVIRWVSKKGTAVELYTTLRDLNEKRGYGVPQH